MEEQETGSTLSLLREAHLLHLRGQFDLAAEKCRTALEQDRLNWEAHELLGDILRDRGDPAAAITEYRAALAIAPAEGQLEEKMARASLLQADLSDTTQPADSDALAPFAPRKRGIAVLLSAITGLGQIYNGQFIKGAILLVVEIILLVVIARISAAVVRQMQMSQNALAEFAPLVAPFIDPRVLPWTILAALCWLYGVVDAAVVSARQAERQTSQTLLE